MFKKYFFLLFIVIFLWGIGLRAVEVLSGNYIFNFDAGRDLLVAQKIVVDHKLTLIGAEIGSGSAGINGIFQGPGYYYLLAIAYWLFGGDPYGALLLMFVCGVLSLYLVYWSIRRIFDEKTALLSLFLIGASPLLASQSRFIWSPHPGTVLLVLLFYFMYQVPRKSRLFAPLALITAGLTYHFELAMTVPIVFAILLSLPTVYRIRDVRVYLYSAISLMAVFFPFFLFEMRHGFMAIKSAFIYNTPQGPVGGDVWFLRITDHLGPYIANAVNSFATEHGFIPLNLLGILCGLLLAALVYFSVRTKHRQKRLLFQFLLLLLVVSYATLLFLNNIIWDYYLIHAHFIYIYIFAYSFFFVWGNMRKSLTLKTVWGLLCIFLLSMIMSSVWRMKSNYTYDYHDYGGFEKIKGKKAAIDYVYQDAKASLPAGRQEFSVFVFVPPIYAYPYEYLFATYGKKKYGYTPGSEKKGLVYLIIEPDPSKPWTYKGWLETVIVDGEIINTVTLPTGHIIQKRVFPL